jgi:23S rRNA pseudoU1915 N3-methylase RlmH
MKLTVAWIGKTKSAALQSLTDEYLKRLRQYAETEGISFKDENALLKSCGRDGRGPRRRLVLLDRGGKQFSSEELAGSSVITRTKTLFLWFLRLVRPMASANLPVNRPISHCLLER